MAATGNGTGAIPKPPEPPALDIESDGVFLRSSFCESIFLDFDLDFRPDGLRRIILHIPPPVAGFHTGQDTKQLMGHQLDAG
jgi:hypothetical protein